MKKLIYILSLFIVSCTTITQKEYTPAKSYFSLRDTFKHVISIDTSVKWYTIITTTHLDGNIIQRVVGGHVIRIDTSTRKYTIITTGSNTATGGGNTIDYIVGGNGEEIVSKTESVSDKIYTINFDDGSSIEQINRCNYSVGQCIYYKIAK